MSKSDSEIAREQGISRQAIRDRRNQGWSQEEIEAGVRSQPRKSRYSTPISRALGMTVKEAAEKEGVSVGEIYRRFHNTVRSKGASVQKG